eukprot:6196352-Pleurochrysis_carterae.AAC.1
MMIMTILHVIIKVKVKVNSFLSVCARKKNLGTISSGFSSLNYYIYPYRSSFSLQKFHPVSIWLLSMLVDLDPRHAVRTSIAQGRAAAQAHNRHLHCRSASKGRQSREPMAVNGCMCEAKPMLN